MEYPGLSPSPTVFFLFVEPSRKPADSLQGPHYDAELKDKE